MPDTPMATPVAPGFMGGRGPARPGRPAGRPGWPRLAARALTAGAAALGAAGCGGPTAPPFDASRALTDGVFVGESSPDEQGAYGRSTVTVRGGEIVASEYVTVQANGSVKAEDYGKDSSGQVANRSAYRAAQKAVAAFDVYARELIETGVPADVDSVSGATIAYGQFLEASTAALVASQEGREAGADRDGGEAGAP